MYRLTGFADEVCSDFDEQMSFWHENGLRYFELRSAWGVNVMDLSDSQLQTIREITNGLGIRLSCVGSPIGKSYIEDPVDFEVARLKKAINIAKFFDCDRIRVFSFYSKEGSIASKRKEVVERLSFLSAISGKEGILLLHENERNIYGELSPECADLAAAVASPFFKLVFDPGNYSVNGEDSLIAEANIRDYIGHLHIKDYSGHDRAMVVTGEGVSHIKTILNDLKGQDLFVALEPHMVHGGQFGGFSGHENFKKCIDATRRIFREIGADYE